MIHMVVLVALLATVAMAVVRDFQKPSTTRVIGAVLAGALSAGVALSAGMHMCGLGQPISQWVLPAVSVTAGLMFIKKPILRRALVAIALVAGVGLSLHYATEVHGPRTLALHRPTRTTGSEKPNGNGIRG